MTTEQYANWTDAMYQHLSWCLFKKVYGSIEWYEQEGKRIGALMVKWSVLLTDSQCKIVQNRALRLGNDYADWALESYERKYGQDSGDIDYDYGEDDFRRASVDYNIEYYEIWKDAVRKKLSVKIIYDSTTSGVSERLVDPYKSSAPYGEGYCHNRHESRKFRFDRIIDIKMTDKRFIKPKVL